MRIQPATVSVTVGGSGPRDIGPDAPLGPVWLDAEKPTEGIQRLYFLGSLFIPPWPAKCSVDELREDSKVLIHHFGALYMHSA